LEECWVGFADGQVWVELRHLWEGVNLHITKRNPVPR
jgi:hypothetical protein